MFQSVLRSLHRDRRRLTFSWTLVVIATIIGYDTMPDPIPYVSTELLAFVVILIAMPLVALFAPTKRYAIEVAAIGNLLFVIFGLLLPDTAFNTANPNVAFGASVALYGLTLVFTHMLINGHWSDGFWQTGSVASATRCQTRLPARALWYGMVPTPGHIDEYPNPDVVSIDYCDRGHREVRVITWAPGADQSEVKVHLLDHLPLKRAKLRIEMPGAEADPLLEGVSTLMIRECGETRVLWVKHEIGGLPLRRALRGWLDDTLGRVIDARVGGIEAAYALAQKDGLRRRALAPHSISPAAVLSDICPAEPDHRKRRKTDSDAFTLTRDLDDVEARLKQVPKGHSSVGAMGKSWLQEG